MNFKVFCNHDERQMSEKKINKYSGKINPLGVQKIMRGFILEVNSEGLEL